MLGIPLERSNYALSNDVLRYAHFLTYATALSTGMGFYITSLICCPATLEGTTKVVWSRSSHVPCVHWRIGGSSNCCLHFLCVANRVFLLVMHTK